MYVGLNRPRSEAVPNASGGALTSTSATNPATNDCSRLLVRLLSGNDGSLLLLSYRMTTPPAPPGCCSTPPGCSTSASAACPARPAACPGSCCSATDLSSKKGKGNKARQGKRRRRQRQDVSKKVSDERRSLPTPHVRDGTPGLRGLKTRYIFVRQHGSGRSRKTLTYALKDYFVTPPSTKLKSNSCFVGLVSEDLHA